MASMVKVLTPAASTRLCTVDAIKAELNIIGSDQDEFFASAVDQASGAITAYLRRVLGEETIREVWRDTDIPCGMGLIVSRYPILSISEVVVDATILTPDQYEYDSEKSVIYRVDAQNDWQSWRPAGKVAVTYSAGYRLPEQGNATLPSPIERACIELVKKANFARFRDPMLRSETIPGVITSEFWVGSTGSEVGGIPGDIASLLDPYRSVGGW